MRRAATGLLLASSVVLLLSPVAFALPPDRALTQYVHDAWGKRDGLPVNSVTDLVQDLDDYLWLATPAGLVRFDGLRFVVFDASNVEAFDNNVVEAVHVDRDGRLWVGGPSGLFVRDGEEFASILDADGERLPHVNRIVADRSGAVWVSHADGVAFVDNDIAREYLLPDGASPGRCSGILFASDDSIWFAGRRLLQVRGETVRVVGKDPPGAEQAYCVTEDSGGEIWIGTSGAGLRRVDASGDLTTVPGTEGLAVFDVEWRDGAVWFASFSRGLGRFADAEVTFLGSAEGLISDDLFSVIEDRQGNLWFGTQSGGLNRLRDAPFITVSVRDGLPHRSVAAVFEDDQRRVWIGTSGGGLARRDPDGWKRWGTEDGLGSPAIMAIGQDAGGRIWVGTGNAGVYVEDGGRFRRVLRDGADAIPNVFVLVPGRAGGMLVGGNGGIVWTDGERFEDVAGIFKTRSWFATGAAFEGDALWLGSMSTGLMRILDGQAEVYSTDDGLSADGVIAVHVGRAGDVWLGTYGGGLQRRSNDVWQTIRARDGLCEDVVYSILEDARGDLWLGGNLGVCRVGRDSLTRFVNGEADRVESTLYGRDDGIAAAECGGGPRNSAWRMDDGTLWFATPDGAAWVDPERADRARPAPPVVIESLTCEGRAIAVRDGVVAEPLPAGTAGCEVRFSAPLAERSEQITFRYRMQGLDDRWIDGGHSRSATYGSIGPGRYAFGVVAVSASGEETEQPALLEFRVLPTFYQTRGFKLLVALVLVSFMFLLYRIRVRRLLRDQQRLEGEVDARTEELRRLTEQLEASNQTLEQRVQDGIEALRRSERLAAYGQMVASVAHEVRHPIFALQAAGFVLADRLKGDREAAPQLRTLELETHRMGTLMEELLQFARPATLRRAREQIGPLIDEALEVFRAEHPDASLELRVRVDQELPPVEVDRQRMVQVIVNLLANALRHAGPATRVEIHADAERGDGGGRVRLRVIDDGTGIDPELLDHVFEPFVTSGSGTGLGLAIVQRVIQDHEGAICAFNRPEGGAGFEILLQGF